MKVWPVLSNYWDRFGVQHTGIEDIFDSFDKAKLYVERIPCLNRCKTIDDRTYFNMAIKVCPDKVVEYYILKEGMEVL